MKNNEKIVNIESKQNEAKEQKKVLANGMTFGQTVFLTALQQTGSIVLGICTIGASIVAVNNNIGNIQGTVRRR